MTQTALEDLVSGAEVARRLGVSRQRVPQLASAHEDFPRPLGTLGKATVYRDREIADWAREHGRRYADDVFAAFEREARELADRVRAAGHPARQRLVRFMHWDASDGGESARVGVGELEDAWHDLFGRASQAGLSPNELGDLERLIETAL